MLLQLQFSKDIPALKIVYLKNLWHPRFYTAIFFSSLFPYYSTKQETGEESNNPQGNVTNQSQKRRASAVRKTDTTD